MIRTGIGYDIHPFADGRPLRLGGIDIPSNRGLAGHSDADVLLHAVADALLGAAALGDIGFHFPPGRTETLGIDSGAILRHCRNLAREEGYEVVNVDTTVIAEFPMISPFIMRLRESIAGMLAIPTSSVSVKATTNEGLGPIGRGEGMAALAIVTVQSLERIIQR